MLPVELVEESIGKASIDLGQIHCTSSVRYLNYTSLAGACMWEGVLKSREGELVVF